MLNNLKELLQNSNLQEKIKAAADKATVIELLLIAGAEKGYSFTVESINNFLSETNTPSNELSENDLLGMSGGSFPTRHCRTWNFICL
jgi:predicted ribosomally synthesized peptide with nif11-like leader